MENFCRQDVHGIMQEAEDHEEIGGQGHGLAHHTATVKFFPQRIDLEDANVGVVAREKFIYILQ